MNEKIIDLLIRSFDEKLSKEEKQKLSQKLEKSEELRQEKIRLEKMRTGIFESRSESFKPFFAEKVMKKIEAIQKPNAELNGLERLYNYIFRRVAIIGVGVIFILLLYNIIQTDHVTMAALFGIPEVTYEEIIEPIFTLG